VKRYEVSFRPEVHDDLAALDDKVRRRLFAKLKWLSEHGVKHP